MFLYGCETLPRALREEHRLRVIEKRDEVTGEWRQLHNEEHHNLYSSIRTIRMIKFKRMRWTGDVARMGKKSNAYRILKGEPVGKRPLDRPRPR
jgi:hypothetical protein